MEKISCLTQSERNWISQPSRRATHLQKVGTTQSARSDDVVTSDDFWKELVLCRELANLMDVSIIASVLVVCALKVDLDMLSLRTICKFRPSSESEIPDFGKV